MSISESHSQSAERFGVSGILARLKAHKDDDAPQARKASKPEIEPNEDRWPLPGLAPMTRVRTSFGDVHAVALRVGDLVKTRSGEFKKIVWLNRVLLDEAFLSDKPDSNPVRIHAGALGPSTPSHDLMMSPRQKVCPTAKANLQERREAGDLTSKPGVMRQRETGLSYTMFHLGEAAEVQCEGVFLLFEPPSM